MEGSFADDAEYVVCSYIRFIGVVMSVPQLIHNHM